MGIFNKPRLRSREKRDDMPEGLWAKCPECGAMLHTLELKQHLQTCHHCGNHFLMDSSERITLLADPGSFVETDAGLISANPLNFAGYESKTAALREKTGLNDAVVTGRLTVGGKPAMIAVMDFKYFAGSMGSVVGEKITRAVETAVAEKRGMIIVSASSGARMQEGMLSLMQMPRTTVAVQMLKEAGLPYIVVLCHPTTGGVTASYAMLGDVQIAEPNAQIGFAGARVIEQTIREKLPEGFQRAEYLLDHGMLDRVVHRKAMRDELVTLVRLLMGLPPAIKGDLPAPVEASVPAKAGS